MNYSETTTDTMPDIQQAEHVLHEVFGFEEFRSLQKDIIQNVLQKKDTLAIMPTGGGKSLCYQIPALLFDGLTIVVSPLISLMKDQVDQLTAYGVSASYLNSSLSPQNYEATLDLIRRNKLDLLYLAPETLLKGSILNLLSGLNVDCVAIDEAHCISEWGHDFRPEYRQLSEVTNKFENAVSLGLTATATPRVQTDIAKSLGLADANTFVASFNRKNLYLDVVTKSSPLQQTINFLRRHEGDSGIIYCFSRKQVDQLTQDLNANGFNALPYHAGLGEGERVKNQDAFIRDEVDIIVATIAFGMGIDKPDVRFVVHHDMPKNIESYYQQIGRAGRDGLQSDCLFLFSYGDASKIRYFIDQKTGDEQRVAEEHLQKLMDYVEAHQCRRIKLLGYFGEHYNEQNCGMCDFCTGDTPERENITVPVQKFLSTMARTEQRFGYNHILNILLGSRRKEVLKFNHDKLSTYGIGKEFSRPEWKQVYRELMKQDIIVREFEHKSLKLTPKAIKILKGDKKVLGVIDEPVQKTRTKSSKSDIESLDFNRDLFALLREKRMNLARKQGIPPFIIFGDTTLIEMAYYYPQSKDSLLKIHGVGRAKAKKYGEKFLEVINSFCKKNNLEERSKSGTNQKTRAVKKTLSKDSRPFEVGQMFQKGKTVSEIASEIGVKEGTVVGYLSKFVKAGHSVPSDNILEASGLSDEEMSKVHKAFDEHGHELLRPVFDALKEEVSYDELRVIQLYMRVKG
ncbi:MAG: DNA helicase RecQ [Balneola sp.]|nr:DNA helicase RecQ [Balneola sp.]|tara:strand:- start:15240 stop:17456 length:2217 start_codon:yes stop_codon:yes gene_type:complete